MTVRELIEKLEHVSEHRLETEVEFWVENEEESGNYDVTALTHIGTAIEIELS